MRVLLILLFLSGCAVTDRIADTKEVQLIRVERNCVVYVPRDWLDDKTISAKLSDIQGCYK